MKTIQRAAAIACIASVVFSSACASTRIRSQIDPQFRGHVYRKVMVFVDFSDLALRQDAERRFQASLSARGTEVVRSTDLFFAGRSYTTDEIAGILRQAQIEAVLVAASTGAGSRSVWIPPTETTETRGTATVTGNTVSGRSTSTTTTSGGYNLNKPWANFEAVLHDVTSGDVVWLATMSSGGNAFADWGDLAKSMAKKTSDQLWKDGLVR